MKKILLPFLLSFALYANVKEEVSQCKNWDELNSYYTSISKSNYKVRFLLKYSKDVSREFVNSNDCPNWFVNAVHASLKSDDGLQVIEAIKCVRSHSLVGLLNDLYKVYKESPNLHGGTSVAVQAEVLLVLSTFKDAKSVDVIKKIYSETTKEHIGHPNLYQLLTTIAPYANSSTKVKTTELIDEIKKMKNKSRSNDSEQAKKLNSYLDVLEGMK